MSFRRPIKYSTYMLSRETVPSGPRAQQLHVHVQSAGSFCTMHHGRGGVELCQDVKIKSLGSCQASPSSKDPPQELLLEYKFFLQIRTESHHFHNIIANTSLNSGLLYP